MRLLPATRIGIAARLNMVRAGLTSILESAYEIVDPQDDPDGLVLDMDEWPVDLPVDRPTLVLTDSPSMARHLAGAQLPSWGAIRRDSDEAAILAALRCVLQGQVVCEAEWLPVQAQLLSDVEANLSPREQAVLQFMAQGLANKEIAAKLGISIHTVKFHVASVLVKLGAASRTEAVTDGIRQGLVAL